jgi:hypothetical protein
MARSWWVYVRRHHVGLLALFVALGGTSFAATQIPGSDGVIHACYQTSSGTLRVVAAGKKCGRSARALAFNQLGRQGPAGAKGAQGSAGPQGVAGPQGGPGQPGNPAAYPTILPSGRTEVGVYSTRIKSSAAGETIAAAITFPIPLAAAPSPKIDPDPSCTGTVSAPTAPRGVLCIYPGQTVNASLFVTDDQGNVGSASPQGAAVQAFANAGSADTIAQGSWAVTAP